MKSVHSDSGEQEGYCFGVASSTQKPIHYSFREAQNFGAIFLGASGSGKTYAIQRAVKHMPSKDGVTIHILDKKDDFCAEGFQKNGLAYDMAEGIIEDIDFSYVNGNAGLNIFQFSKMAEGGGVYMAIREIISICKLFNSSFSQKMGNYLQWILKRVYADYGIDHEDMNTWDNDTPTLVDVLKEINRIYYNLVNDNKMSDTGFWNELAVLVSRYPEESCKAVKSDSVKYAQEVLEQAKQEHLECYAKEWQASTLLSLRDTISDMVESKLFSRQPMQRKMRRINRYRLIGLEASHLKIAQRVVLNQTFNMAVRQTLKDKSFNPIIPAHVAVVDEGKDSVTMGKGIHNPMDRIATEGRGYGLGLWLGVQDTQHITRDILTNSALKSIFAVESSALSNTKKMFGVDEKRLRQLVPKRNRLVNFGGGYSLAYQ